MITEEKVQSNNTDFELGQLYFEKCEFLKAEKFYVAAKKSFLAEKNIPAFLKCVQRLLRIYAEMERFDDVEDLKESLQGLVLKEKLKLDSRTYFTLGLCAFFKDQKDVALEYEEKALALALATDNKEDICYAIHGIAIVYASLGRLDDALKEIYNLKVFFQVISVPELEITSQIVNAHIFRLLGQFDKALDLLWGSYEKLKQNKTFLLHLELLYAMGITYQDAGQPDLARLYLGLARRSLDPDIMKNMKNAVDERLSQLGQTNEAQYDLIFNTAAKTVTERKRGKVDFNNQFILLDLLKLFLRKPGEVHSKEEIVYRVWKQDYDPSVHDNKLYVTIKRLRKMIEPDYEKPKYIFRAKNGYYLNKGTKVLMQN